MLVGDEKVDLPLWPQLLDAVSGRLRDESVMVAKAALQAVQTMVM